MIKKQTEIHPLPYIVVVRTFAGKGVGGAVECEQGNPLRPTHHHSPHRAGGYTFAVKGARVYRGLRYIVRESHTLRLKTVMVFEPLRLRVFGALR